MGRDVSKQMTRAGSFRPPTCRVPERSRRDVSKVGQTAYSQDSGAGTTPSVVSASARSVRCWRRSFARAVTQTIPRGPASATTSANGQICIPNSVAAANGAWLPHQQPTCFRTRPAGHRSSARNFGGVHSRRCVQFAVFTWRAARQTEPHVPWSQSHCDTSPRGVGTGTVRCVLGTKSRGPAPPPRVHRPCDHARAAGH